MRIDFAPDIKYPPIIFGVSSKLKKAYKQGLFEGLKSFTGEELKHPSIDHIKPKSQGGKNCIYNYVLTNCKENSLRGDRNIDYFIEQNEKAAIQYIGWFLTHNVKGFNCLDYALGIIRTLNKASKKYKFKIEDIINYT